MTPQGISAVLHNDNLVSRFTHDGAPTQQGHPRTGCADPVSGYRWAVGKGRRLASHERNAWLARKSRPGISVRSIW